MNGESIHRLPQVMARVGLGRANIYKMVLEGTFPKPVRLGPRAVGWLSSDIDKWISTLAKSKGKT